MEEEEVAGGLRLAPYRWRERWPRDEVVASRLDCRPEACRSRRTDSRARTALCLVRELRSSRGRTVTGLGRRLISCCGVPRADRPPGNHPRWRQQPGLHELIRLRLALRSPQELLDPSWTGSRPSVAALPGFDAYLPRPRSHS